MQTCSRPQSMALVQLGGAQTSCSLQVAPRAQSPLPWQWLPTGVQTEAMQLLPASQSPEREHCGSIEHIPRDTRRPRGAIGRLRTLGIDAARTADHGDHREQDSEDCRRDEDRKRPAVHVTSMSCLRLQRNPVNT